MKTYRRGLIICLFLLFLLSACTPVRNGGDTLLEVIFLDVGQGDSILLRTKEGDVLIDAGCEESERELCRKLRTYGVKTLLLAIFSHFDEDHIGGADGVLREFPAREIWVPTAGAPNEAARSLLSVAMSSGTNVCEVTAGRMQSVGDIVLFVFSPKHSAASDANESGIVFKVTCRNTAALFMGDAGVDTEREMLEEYGAAHFEASLYKVGHHGSSTSSSMDFLRAVKPDWAVISAAASNSYGHPHGEVLLRLSQIGATVLRTDRQGDIVFDCDGERFALRNTD